MKKRVTAGKRTPEPVKKTARVGTLVSSKETAMFRIQVCFKRNSQVKDPSLFQKKQPGEGPKLF